MKGEFYLFIVVILILRHGLALSFTEEILRYMPCQRQALSVEKPTSGQCASRIDQ